MAGSKRLRDEALGDIGLDEYDAHSAKRPAYVSELRHLADDDDGGVVVAPGATLTGNGPQLPGVAEAAAEAAKEHEGHVARSGNVPMRIEEGAPTQTQADARGPTHTEVEVAAAFPAKNTGSQQQQHEHELNSVTVSGGSSSARRSRHRAPNGSRSSSSSASVTPEEERQNSSGSSSSSSSSGTSGVPDDSSSVSTAMMYFNMCTRSERSGCQCRAAAVVAGAEYWRATELGDLDTRYLSLALTMAVALARRLYWCRALACVFVSCACWCVHTVGTQRKAGKRQVRAKSDYCPEAYISDEEVATLFLDESDDEFDHGGHFHDDDDDDDDLLEDDDDDDGDYGTRVTKRRRRRGGVTSTSAGAGGASNRKRPRRQGSRV